MDAQTRHPVRQIGIELSQDGGNGGRDGRPVQRRLYVKRDISAAVLTQGLVEERPVTFSGSHGLGVLHDTDNVSNGTVRSNTQRRADGFAWRHLKSLRKRDVDDHRRR